MFALIFSLILSSVSFALEVVKYESKDKIVLKIIRAETESFETYTLLNHNGREMTLVCANNRVYDNNPLPFIRYRNFFGEEVGDFTLESEDVCKDMAKFIEVASYGVDEKRAFIITLSTKTMSVDQVVFPKVDIFADDGNIRDLLPKRRIFIQGKPQEPKPKDEKMLTPQRKNLQ